MVTRDESEVVVSKRAPTLQGSAPVVRRRRVGRVQIGRGISTTTACPAAGTRGTLSRGNRGMDIGGRVRTSGVHGTDTVFSMACIRRTLLTKPKLEIQEEPGQCNES